MLYTYLTNYFDKAIWTPIVSAVWQLHGLLIPKEIEAMIWEIHETIPLLYRMDTLVASIPPRHEALCGHPYWDCLKPLCEALALKERLEKKLGFGILTRKFIKWHRMWKAQQRRAVVIKYNYHWNWYSTSVSAYYITHRIYSSSLRVIPPIQQRAQTSLINIDTIAASENWRFYRDYQLSINVDN